MRATHNEQTSNLVSKIERFAPATLNPEKLRLFRELVEDGESDMAIEWALDWAAYDLWEMPFELIHDIGDWVEGLCNESFREAARNAIIHATDKEIAKIKEG